MNCPYCNSPVLLNDVAGNPWYQCGTTKTFRSASCVDREPLATELRNALARIKRLEEALNDIAKEVPAHDGGGGLFWPMFDGDGNEIGVQPVDPLTVIGAMHTRALDALRGEEAKEATP